MAFHEAAETTALLTARPGPAQAGWATVGVFPPSAFHRRPRLFEALRRVLPVEFEPRSEGAFGDLDAAVVFGSGADVDLTPSDLPCLVLLRQLEAPGAMSMPVAFSSAHELDPRLRSRTLQERTIVGLPFLDTSADGVALASVEGDPVWWTSRSGGASVEVVAAAPSELRANESLRESMAHGRFIALLPLFHFLRKLTGYDTWDRPPVHAAFVVDDPNLHRPSYGCIHYDELAEHATAHGYHVAMATIPLDTWFTSRRAARIFRDHPEQLSLTAHGNDHRYHELAAWADGDSSPAIFAQATRRLERFEWRTGIPVSRVMVPPHGVCPNELLESMLLGGFEAYCNSARWWREWPADQRLVAGWSPMTTACGLPIMSRHYLGHGALRDELVFDAYLDKPLVICAHHTDFAGGYDRLAELADWLRSFGAVRWGSLATLSRSTVVTHNEDEGSLRVKSWTRRFTVDVPDEVERLLVELPFPSDGSVLQCNGTPVRVARTVADRLFAEVDVEAGRPATFSLVPPRAGLEAIAPRRSPVTAFLRRGVAEGRDRLYPAIRLLRADRILRRMELRYDRFMRARLERRRRPVRL